jgi:hypothetical protein
MTSHLRRALIATMLTGLAMAPAAAAEARSITNIDQRGDVFSFDESENPTPEPGIVNGDILKTRLSHGINRVRVKVRFADLKRKGAFRGEYVRIRTNAGVRGSVSLYAGPGDWQGFAQLNRNDGTHFGCSIGHSISYADNIVRLSVPRSCLDNPRWVRLGVGSFWYSADGSRVFADDALLDGKVHANYVTLSVRKIRQG